MYQCCGKLLHVLDFMAYSSTLFYIDLVLYTSYFFFSVKYSHETTNLFVVIYRLLGSGSDCNETLHDYSVIRLQLSKYSNVENCFSFEPGPQS